MNINISKMNKFNLRLISISIRLPVNILDYSKYMSFMLSINNPQLYSTFQHNGVLRCCIVEEQAPNVSVLHYLVLSKPDIVKGCDLYIDQFGYRIRVCQIFLVRKLPHSSLSL